MDKWKVEEIKKILKKLGVEPEENSCFGIFKKILLGQSKPMSNKEVLEHSKMDLMRIKLPDEIEEDLKLLTLIFRNRRLAEGIDKNVLECS